MLERLLRGAERARPHGSPIVERPDDREFLRDRAFRDFETTKPDGVGLGLTTAHQIVRFHQGSMRVLSEPGGGTVVRLNFPGIIPEAPAASESS